MGIETAIVGGLGLVGGALGAREARKGAERAAEATERAGEAAIGEQEAAREQALRLAQPFVNFGSLARDPLAQALNIGPTSRASLEAQQAQLQDLFARKGDRNFVGRPQQEARLAQINAQMERMGPAQQLPGLPNALDLSALPAGGQAFDPAAVADNTIFDFLMEEGFRGIRESAAGGGRSPDRDLVRFAQGTAASLVPALQQQQFGQQQALRAQALGEQGVQFAQMGGLRDQARAEQQQNINNLMAALGIGQSAAAGQAATGLGTAANIGNILGNIGTAQSQAALAKSAANQHNIGNLVGLGALGASSLRPRFGDVGSTLQGRPIDALGLPQQGPTTFFGGF